MTDETISITGLECPDCGSPKGEWCRNKRTGEVRGGALLSCPERTRAVTAHNRAITGFDANS